MDSGDWTCQDAVGCSGGRDADKCSTRSMDAIGGSVSLEMS